MVASPLSPGRAASLRIAGRQLSVQVLAKRGSSDGCCPGTGSVSVRNGGVIQTWQTVIGDNSVLGGNGT